MPKFADGALFLVAPCIMAILAIKFLRNNFDCTENDHQCRGKKFAGHLRILDSRRPALGTTHESLGDDWIARLPFDHQPLGTFKILVVHENLDVSLRLRHETDSLQRRLIMDIGADTDLLKSRLSAPLPLAGSFKVAIVTIIFLAFAGRLLMKHQLMTECNIRRWEPFVENEINKNACHGNIEPDGHGPPAETAMPVPTALEHRNQRHDYKGQSYKREQNMRNEYREVNGCDPSAVAG